MSLLGTAREVGAIPVRHLPCDCLSGRAPSRDNKEVALGKSTHQRYLFLAMCFALIAGCSTDFQSYEDGIIGLALAKGIPFKTASDAHSHAQLGENFTALRL
jgi:hypothetical protein